MKLNRPQSSRENGFTLLELLVVIAIIAILAALTLGGFKYAQEASAKNRTMTSLAVIKAGLEQYKEKHGEYPLPADADSTAEVGNMKIRAGGARMLYQALTGDGDNAIQLSAPQNTISDGKLTDEETANTINSELISMKNLVVRSSDGYYFADGWMRPFQYERSAPATPGEDPKETVNPTYDLWSFGTAGSTQGGVEDYDIATRRDPQRTARWIKNW
ncbi:prepilin-type N-terminal cleavage/methylation domain-containing protein [Roseimicrobium gellanilyticum]|uniref:Prepilin-type N-terminal cleavage/methylation domain-containing protein n=1 Tax=Roseimicrobium gellanilyticum TaxID=748857 RepID=A0A366HVR3_9BACT|nr:prepilin-type N-terminal cleavage/methylation domain-containing protein [Roseimicrobium gellanilyticum]RBP47789.1 prepilin-type N-terminal cleavage/methylation domain-containing protein [Roseimicrobium gellanilyticum]